jgi:hypothetical protein
MIARRNRRIVVFDTNVFVRGFKSRSEGSPNKRLVRLWLVRHVQIVVCDDRPPTNRSGDAPVVTKVPRYIERAIKKNRAASTFFQGLAPGYRRQYVAWIDSAKREATKLKRLDEAIQRLAAGQKPGLK